MRVVAATLALALCGGYVTAWQSSDIALIEWSADRKLTPKDFNGKVPPRSTDASRSHVTIDAAWECRDGSATSHARAVFDPNQSWWKPPSFPLWQAVDQRIAAPRAIDSERHLLAHEQLHFDLTEVWTIKIRD